LPNLVHALHGLALIIYVMLQASVLKGLSAYLLTETLRL